MKQGHRGVGSKWLARGFATTAVRCWHWMVLAELGMNKLRVVGQQRQVWAWGSR